MSSTETDYLTPEDKDVLDAILLALWQCQTERGYEHLRAKVEGEVQQIIAARRAEALREVATDLGVIYQADSAGVTAAIHYLRLRADALSSPTGGGA